MQVRLSKPQDNLHIQKPPCGEVNGSLLSGILLSLEINSIRFPAPCSLIA